MIPAALPPLAVGFFGLGIGYFVFGGSVFLNFQKKATKT